MSTLGKLCILVADDSPSIRQILETLLSRQGHLVLTAEDGEQALEIFYRQRVDMVLLDIRMPKLDGLEVARRIRAEEQQRWVPVILLSALERDDNLKAGLEAGADDFLSKPLDFALLDARIRSMQKALDLQRQAEESYSQLKAVSDSVLDAIITIDRNGLIISANRPSEKLLGWSPGELVGREVESLMHESERSGHCNYLHAYLANGAPSIIGQRREVAVQRKDGSSFPAELAVSEVQHNGQRTFVGVLRDITERKEAQRQQQTIAEALQRYHDRSEEENRLAMSILDKQTLRPGLQDPAVHYWLAGATDFFCGDVVAASRAPDGSLLALLSDATGHGLTAAISNLPLLTAFYGIAHRGRSMKVLLEEMNRHLKAALPTGHFVAATVVHINPREGKGEIWSGGMPPAAMLTADGSVDRTFLSRHLPLGILRNEDFDPSTESFTCPPDSQLLMYSDGLKEAEGSDGQQLGSDGLLRALRGTSANNRLECLRSLLEKHRAGKRAADDIAVMLIDCRKDGNGEP